MRPITSNQRWFAAAVCLLASSGFAVGQEGVVRISDEATRPGVVRMNALQQPAIRQTSYGPQTPNLQAGFQQPVPYQYGQRVPGGIQANAWQPGNPYHPAGYALPVGHSLATLQTAGYAVGGHSIGCGCTPGGGCGCTSAGCGSAACGHQGCCDVGSCDAGRCSRRQMRKNGCNSCDDCYYGDGYRHRMWTLFAKPVPANCCNNQCRANRWWRGQQLNYLARNQRLSNHLFGWLVPSGCCGQGCPPIGKYCVNYADDPGYVDGRDAGPAYGVQGYGMPLSVPLAPNVRQAYNYSWGTPASRITQIGQYSPGNTAPQPLYHQSW